MKIDDRLTYPHLRSYRSGVEFMFRREELMGHPEAARRLHDVARELYRAALQPNPLDLWSRSIAKLLGTRIAGFTVFSPSGVAVINGSVGSDGKAGQEYMEHYQYINPLRKFWQTAAPGRVVRIDSSLIDESFRRTEFYSRYHTHLDEGAGIGMMLPIRTAKVLLHASQPEGSGYEPIAQDLLASLYEDLLLSFEIAGSLTLASNITGNVIRSLDHKGIGVALLSEDGHIEHANNSMSEILHAGNVLKVEQGRLSPGSSVRLPDLPGIVHRTRRSGIGGRLLYGDETDSCRGSILTYPAPAAFDWEGQHESKVVLIVTDSSRPKGLLIEALRKTYGLTQAEARVAGMLLDGKTSRHMATELGVQINSVRAHLKAIYAKTDTHSQVELLKRLQTEKEEIH
ncbi:helix-turn-helix transcriptional regulator [Agrobacterium sp. NPDC089420]|uniref:helix-turn-helix transcriptional regulator n=1 Tax=Agrobacterium sp. NPDC089420 TaxID=3363918 RepID=UPI00384FED19